MTDLYEGVEFLSDSDQEIFTDEVRLGLAESPLRAQLPALGVAATEERDLARRGDHYNHTGHIKVRDEVRGSQHVIKT